MTNSKKRIGILTGGGDVQPLNIILSSVKEAAAKEGIETIGFIKGWQGILSREFISLSETIVPSDIGGTILKSSRINLAAVEHGVEIVSEVYKELGLSALVVIGGEDTLSNVFLVPEIPCLLISKTIDNDVGTADDEFINYFTFGYPSASEKIVSFISQEEGLRSTAYSHERIVIVESMGMHAGWLCLAAGMGDPDMIIIPEVPLDYGRFLERALEIFINKKHAIIVVAEGARWNDGTYINAIPDEGLGFMHPRFGGSACALSAKMKSDLSKRINTRNINYVNPSYLYRSGRPNELDRIMGTRAGIEAVRIIREKPGGSFFLAIERKGDGFCISPVRIDAYSSMNALHRFVKDEFYDTEKYRITAAAKKYLSVMVNEKNEKEYGFR